MKKVYLVFCLLTLAMIGLSGHRYYDKHHLSSDLRRTLVAATDVNSTPDDVRSYLRQARLQVRTEKDTDELDRFENGFNLFINAAESEEKTNQEMKELSDEISSATTSTLGNIDPEDWKKTYELRLAHVKQDGDQSKEEMAAGRKLISQVRHDLGLVPVPVFEQ